MNASIGLPDIHSDTVSLSEISLLLMSILEDVSPGGVGFDINCGVRMLRSNLNISDLAANPELKEKLCDELFKSIPVGVGCRGEINLSGSRNQ